LEKIVQKIPFLRPTIALALGVYLGSVFEILTQIALIICFCSLLTIILIHVYFKYQLSNWFGIILHLFFISLGTVSFNIYNNEPVLLESGIFYAMVLEKPQEKKNSYKSLIEISEVKNSDCIYQIKENVLVYFEKNTNVIELNAGECIAFKSSPKPIQNYGNPFEFDYKKYLSNKRIYRQIYLSSESWKRIELQKKQTIVILAELAREKLLEVYRNQAFDENEVEILSALTLGYKRGLDPETKQTFSAAGAMHVLAVSGLHVGIIFWAFGLVFGFLRASKSGRVIFVVFSVAILWCYAFITGLSPSVMRAATMFSIFAIGDNLNRKANTYNSLAASAMLLLLINPNNLFEVGFQLSYSAVFGIVFLQPRLSSIFKTKNKILKFIWSLLTVSIAAQIATFPLTSFYFNQFPTYFWGTNLIVIPVAMILIPLGISLLIFAKIPIVAGILTFMLQHIINHTYSILQFIQQLPLSTIPVSIRLTELFLLFGIVLSFFLVINRFKSSYLISLLLFVFSFFTVQLIQSIYQLNNRKMIVYNIPENLTIQLIYGRDNIVVSEHRIEKKDFAHTIIRTANLKSGLHIPEFVTQKDSLFNSFIQFKKGTIFLDKKRLLFNINEQNFPSALAPDIILDSTGKCSFDEQISRKTIFITNKRYYRNMKNDSNRFYSTFNQGAFIQNW